MDYYERQTAKEKLSQYAYYFIIGVISILATGFLPMLGTEIGLEWNLPDTTAGWVVWIVSKLSIALVNILLFHCFMKQAKLNVIKSERYIKAMELLDEVIKHTETKPKSPKKWIASQYLGKGTTIFFTSMMSAIGLTQALLTFDVVGFLTYTFTIVMGIIFGYLQMRKAEDYWTNEFYEFAVQENKKIVKEKENKQCSKKTEKSTATCKNKSAKTKKTLKESHLDSMSSAK